MDVRDLRPWPRTADEARAIQDDLRPLLDLDGPGPQRPRTIAGLDVSYAGDGTDSDDGKDAGFGTDSGQGKGASAGPATLEAGRDGPRPARLAAAVVVLDAGTLEVVEESVATGATAFPYVPGLLAFRELPALVEALRPLKTTPDLLVCDGYGLAHPRRFGLACHLGVLTGLPSMGVAKTPFVGTSEPPGTERGASAPLTADGEVVGRALRTRDGVKPVFVSTGHRIDLDTACRHTLALTPEFRLPETTRRADRLSRDALAAG